QTETLFARAQRVLEPASFRDVGDDAFYRERAPAVVADGAHAEETVAHAAVDVTHLDRGTAQRAVLAERADDVLESDTACVPVAETRLTDQIGFVRVAEHRHERRIRRQQLS